MRELKISPKIVLALLSVMVLVISIGIFTLPAKAASVEACSQYCSKYIDPNNIIRTFPLYAACMDGCVNGPIE